MARQKRQDAIGFLSACLGADPPSPYDMACHHQRETRSPAQGTNSTQDTTWHVTHLAPQIVAALPGTFYEHDMAHQKTPRPAHRRGEATRHGTPPTSKPQRSPRPRSHDMARQNAEGAKGDDDEHAVTWRLPWHAAGAAGESDRHQVLAPKCAQTAHAMACHRWSWRTMTWHADFLWGRRN